jgi:hypothetical protein
MRLSLQHDGECRSDLLHGVVGFGFRQE